MNQVAYDAIEEVWALTIKLRALCPFADSTAIGSVGYISPQWYQTRGAVYFVNLAQPLTASDVQELTEIGSFVNRSFIISMNAILEANSVRRDPTKDGSDYIKLTRLLRNRFAHGEWVYKSYDTKHIEARELLEKLFPVGAAGGQGFVTSINSILEPLKDGVLAYIKAAT